MRSAMMRKRKRHSTHSTRVRLKVAVCSSVDAAGGRGSGTARHLIRDTYGTDWCVTQPFPAGGLGAL